MKQELSDSEIERIERGEPTISDCHKALRGVCLNDEEATRRFEQGVPTMSDCRRLLKVRDALTHESLNRHFSNGLTGERHERWVELDRRKEAWRDDPYIKQRLTEDVATADAPSIFHLSMFRNRR